MSSARQPDDERTPDALGRIRRMVLTLAMLPVLAVAASLATGYICELCESLGVFTQIDDSGQTRIAFDAARLFEFTTSTAFVVAMLVIWRRFVLWTCGRKVWTSIIALVPFVQVCLGRPWWDAGCVTKEILRGGQEYVGIALWIWLVVWIWWGWERLRLSQMRSHSSLWSRRMDRITRTVVACIAVIPACVSVAFISFAVAEDLLDIDSDISVAIAYGVAACTCLVAWCLFWKRHVVWSKRVLLRTLLLWFACMPLPITAMPFTISQPGIVGTTFWNLPLLGWGIWMALTMWIWPLKRIEMATDIGTDGPCCLKCGYSLRGLSTTRCPECGEEPTLDVLWAGQTG